MLNDPGGRERLLALGVRNVPVVSKGKRYVQGQKLEDVAERLSHEVDNRPGFGITGFMYGCAVGMLSKAWIHGEELRRWHNLKTQIRDEGEKANESGGVLNPAVLCIG